MRVKRYVVDSMPDALQKIRADLGKDAIIINTKNIKTGGILGLFAKKQIEVIAAIDVNKGPNPLSKAPVPGTDKKEGNVRKPAASMETLAQDDLRLESTTYDFKTVVSKRVNPPVEKERTEINGGHLPVSDEQEKRSEGLANKDKMDFRALRRRLQDQDVCAEVIEEVIALVGSRYSASILQTEVSQVQHAKLVIEEMLKQHQKEENAIGPNCRFIKFFGPTGVGKTTTIAKLAAEGVLKSKRKVGLITTDTYRIGAVDQLRTYANILNIPLEVVYHPKDIGTAAENLKDCDLILMDTAGRNYRNKEFAVELVNYFPNMEGTENYIVLSLTAKNADMIEILDNFKHIAVDKVIFTKADETRTYGTILNMIFHYHLSLSYLTTGQNVPDDIRVAAPGKIANLILGEDRYV